jgi:predicted DNA-binding protein with PD1-like motif
MRGTPGPPLFFLSGLRLVSRSRIGASSLLEIGRTLGPAGRDPSMLLEASSDLPLLMSGPAAFAFVLRCSSREHPSVRHSDRISQFFCSNTSSPLGSIPAVSTRRRAPLSSRARLLAVRLQPGDDLYLELAAFARSPRRPALALVTCVGSLTHAKVRFANAPDGKTLQGPFEIVSLVGTLAHDGPHLHICLSDRRGACTGGHLQPGSIVYTTAEVVLVEATDLHFDRSMVDETGYAELAVRRRVSGGPGRPQKPRAGPEAQGLRPARPPARRGRRAATPRG